MTTQPANPTVVVKDNFIVCRDCDLICQLAPITAGESGHCPRCRASLLRNPSTSLQTALALAITALLLFVVLNTNPLLSITFQGNRKDATLLSAATAMWNQEMRLIALLVVMTTVVAPAIQIATELYVLCCTAAGRSWSSIGASIQLLIALRPWSMIEILMLGILVSLVKLRAVADIILGPALWSCAALIFVMAALTSSVNANNIWFWTAYGKR